MRTTGVMWSGDDVDYRLCFHTLLSSWHINGFHGSRQRSSTYVIIPWSWPAAQRWLRQQYLWRERIDSATHALPSTPHHLGREKRRGRDAARIIYYNNATINKYYSVRLHRRWRRSSPSMNSSQQPHCYYYYSWWRRSKTIIWPMSSYWLWHSTLPRSISHTSMIPATRYLCHLIYQLPTQIPPRT